MTDIQSVCLSVLFSFFGRRRWRTTRGHPSAPPSASLHVREAVDFVPFVNTSLLRLPRLPRLLALALLYFATHIRENSKDVETTRQEPMPLRRHKERRRPVIAMGDFKQSELLRCCRLPVLENDKGNNCLVGLFFFYEASWCDSDDSDASRLYPHEDILSAQVCRS